MVGGARVRGQWIGVCAGARVRGQRAGVCAVHTAVKWSRSCFMHFTLARFYVRSKGKCSWCKRLAGNCFSAFHVKASHETPASNAREFYVSCSHVKSCHD